uniref:ubiquitinyl hydrolase 1 n=1 Tax=Phytophthora ramorum TaxID=164328 RepID=H3GTW7_PHYRM
MAGQELYHERQQLYRCGLHALNNVLQGPVFSKAALDEACEELATKTHPDAGYVMQWLDKRLPVDDKLVKLDEAEGVLCNVVMSTGFSSLWMQRHWFAVRKIRGVCYNLDSKLPAPVVGKSGD